jgi:hypothetical protein
VLLAVKAEAIKEAENLTNIEMSKIARLAKTTKLRLMKTNKK